MIHLSNTRFGDISVEESSAIHFPRGIIGFSEETQFAIVERENGPIAYLQSLKTPRLARSESRAACAPRRRATAARSRRPSE